MNKLESMLDMKKLNELLGKKEKKKECNVVLWIFAIVGVLVVVGAVVYALLRYFKPDYLEDFEDEFEDEFEDDFDEEEEIFADDIKTEE